MKVLTLQEMLDLVRRQQEKKYVEEREVAWRSDNEEDSEEDSAVVYGKKEIEMETLVDPTSVMIPTFGGTLEEKLESFFSGFHRGPFAAQSTHHIRTTKNERGRK